MNGVAASYVANRTLPENLQNLGGTLFKVALILQLVVIVSFVALATTFYQRCRKNGINHNKVNQPLLTLCISTGIIFARTVYRTVEYFEMETVDYFAVDFDLGKLTPIIRVEWYFYVFEAALMLINSALITPAIPVGGCRRAPRCT